MAKYTLKVHNNSGFNKSYVLFMQPPKAIAKGGQPHVFANAWVTFHGITNGSTDSVTYTDETYAYWATATMPIGPGSTMGQSGTAAVNTATSDSVNFLGSQKTGGVGFGPVSPGGADSGSFDIVAKDDFTASNGYLFGLARPGNVPGIPSPVASFAAQPNDTFNITPVIKFYVADGAYTPGQIIDYTATATKAAAIDFTGRAQDSVVVTQDAHGKFSVQYY